MSDPLLTHLLPLGFAIFVWWFGTLVILFLNRLPRTSHPMVFAGATLVLGAGLAGLALTREDTTLTGAYLAFTCAVLVWSWQEIGFLLGYVTGPRKRPCPEGARGASRFWLALQTLWYHELALLVLGAIVVGLTWGGSNTTGLMAFAVLWVMRQSAKLNVFLGVRNLSEDFLPAHLAYLPSYFRCAPGNAFFPIALLGSSWVALLMWQAAFAPGASAFQAGSLSLSASLLTLAILEHLLMVLPFPSQWLWQWGLRPREADTGR